MWADATHVTWFGGIYQESKNFFPQFPVDPEEYLAMYPEFLLPEEQKEEWFRTRTGAVVGRNTAERFGFEIGDKVPIRATIWTKKNNQLTWEFDIVGIYDGAEQGTDTTQLLFHYDYFDEARQFLRGQVGWYIVRVDDPEDSARVAREIDQTFANSPAETKAETEGAFLTGFAEQIGNIGAVITAIISAVFFTILLVAGNTMAQSVRERTGELAVLKAVGFTDSQVLGLVLASRWRSRRSADSPGSVSRPFSFPPAIRQVAGCRSFISSCGRCPWRGARHHARLVTGALPALQAGRLRIADALRRL